MRASTILVKEDAQTSSLSHLVTALRVSVVSIIALGFVYPLAITGIAQMAFPAQANGSLITENGQLIGSQLVGQNFSLPGYFHGRPSAAGNGYDPTQTGGTNLGPTSKKLMDGISATIKGLRKDNPDAIDQAMPPDLVTSSASGIDPDISIAAAQFQVARIAKARKLDVTAVASVITQHSVPRTFGILGEPRVNVLELNRALDTLAVKKDTVL